MKQNSTSIISINKRLQSSNNSSFKSERNSSNISLSNSEKSKNSNSNNNRPKIYNNNQKKREKLNIYDNEEILNAVKGNLDIQYQKIELKKHNNNNLNEVVKENQPQYGSNDRKLINY
jgi:hypothetical protein